MSATPIIDPLPTGVTARHLTIDSVFAQVRAALDDKHAAVAITYDPVWHNPSVLSVDSLKNAVDDEWALLARAVKATPQDRRRAQRAGTSVPRPPPPVRGSPPFPAGLPRPTFPPLMRKLYLVLAALLATHVALLLVHPSGAQQLETGPGLDVGIVFDLGGRGDKSFNDGAYIGAERAAKELGARVRFIEPGEGSDREAGLRLLAAEGMDLVIGVGFIFSDDLTQLANEYPSVRFAGVDYAVALDSAGNAIQPPHNLAALKFREEQGSFLVGALAALVGKSKKVGFVGGMDFPLIHKFEVGYKAGVKEVCPDCEVIAQYAGVTPEAFRNPGRGQELALSQYQSGVNVIFHASGSTGLGVFEAARRRGKLAIGVDADQYSEAPGYILTSMVKGVDEAVFDAIKQVKDGTFHGGIFQLGLKEHGVDYIYDANNRALIPDSVHARVEALRQRIIAGDIVVPSTR